MIGSDKEFEKQCEEYFSYLYSLARRLYSDCPDIDTLVQETLMALFVKIRKVFWQQFLKISITVG